MLPHDLRRNHAGRATIGLVTALSITLVAFEWRSTGPLTALALEPMVPEDAWEYPRVIIIEQQKVGPVTKAKAKRTVAAEITADDSTTDTAQDAAVDGEEGKVEEGATVDEGTTRGGEDTVIEIFPWTGVEVRPYFMDCMKRSPTDLWGCTEHRIEQHLRRHFRMPPGLRGEVRTVVTFEIDAAGRIGRLACTPRVKPEVEQEVERVLRSMPVFVPGSQNGVPVPVFHRIPITLRSY